MSLYRRDCYPLALRTPGLVGDFSGSRVRLARAVGSSHTWRAVPCGLGGVTSHHAVVADRIMRTVGHIASRWSTVRGHRAHAGRLPGWVRGMATDGQCSACGQGRACGSYLALHAEGVSLGSARLPVAAMCVCSLAVRCRSPLSATPVDLCSPRLLLECPHAAASLACTCPSNHLARGGVRGESAQQLRPVS